MRTNLFCCLIIFLSFTCMGAKPHISSSLPNSKKEINFLDLKLKKEINDKKLSPQKKYLLAILAGRELKQLYYSQLAIEFYKIAQDIKIGGNREEVNEALYKKTPLNSSVFFYEVNLKSLLEKKLYEEAILSLNPEKLNEAENAKYRIVYDLLNVKIKKMAVKKLYSFEDYQKDPDDYKYSNLLCDLLIDYLNDGKLGNDHIKVVEEYFLKHDLKEIYLLQVAKDLKTPDKKY